MNRSHQRDENHSNRCYAARLVYQKRNQTMKCRSCKRRFCVSVVGCGDESGRDREVYFARISFIVTNQGKEAGISFIITNQGKEAENLSNSRRARWVSAIGGCDLTDDILKHDYVCRGHFVSWRAAKG